MKHNENPPSYEESNVQYKTVLQNLNNGTFTSIRGPDAICVGKIFLIADFIPWSESHSYEDMGYLLLRANNWLRDFQCYDIEKCEMIPRMINSKGKLEVSNCYIFNMTCGRRCFVYQLRLHIKINNSKSESDQICLRTIIPEMVQGITTKAENAILLIKLLKCKSGIPKFQEMTEILAKLNCDLEDGIITGKIINISSFYLNLMQYLLSSDTEQRTFFYDEANNDRCHIKCLRIFYKPGAKINCNIDFKCFKDDSSTIVTMDNLINSAIHWIQIQNNITMVSLETSQEYAEMENFGGFESKDNQNSLFSYPDNCTKMMRNEVIELFYFTKFEFSMKCLQTLNKSTGILWLTPRKNRKNIYETYDSFMAYVGFVLLTYGERVVDMETVLIPNSLSWSAVRHQSLKRYFSENSTNYQIYVFRLLIIGGNIPLPLKGAPLPYVSPTKYSTTF